MLSLSSRPLFKDESDVVHIGKPWYIHQTERYGLLLCFSGPEDEDSRWMVKRRISEHRVEAVAMGRVRPREVVFDGPFDAAEMALCGASVDLISRFRGGFPKDWEAVWARPPPPPPENSQPPERRRSKRLEVTAAVEPSETVKEREEAEQGLRRSKRQKDAEEKPCYDEDDLLLRALRKEEAKDHLLEIFGIREEDVPEEDDGDGKGKEEEDDWNDEENQAFQDARLMLNPASPGFWERMSEDFVVSRTAEECQEKWLREAARTSSKSKQATSSLIAFKGVSEEDAMKREERAAKMGTVKFRRQVREDWERVQKKDGNARKDHSLTTPFRSKIESDVLPQSCCKGVFTPVNTFAFGEEEDDDTKHLSILYEETDEEEDNDDDENKRARLQSAASPDVLVEVNRDNLDGYLVHLVKEKKRLQTLKPKRKPQQATMQERYQSMMTATQAETDGIQATLTPGGSVKLKVDRAVFADHEEDELENYSRKAARSAAGGDNDDDADDQYW